MQKQKILFNRIIIIGLGLIGGSIAKICKKNHYCNIIAAYDSDPMQLNFAINQDIINQSYNFGDEIAGDDLIIIAAPLSSYKSIAQKIAPDIDKNTIIIDIGSIKSFVETDIVPIFGNNSKNFVPCHPIAGSEKSGIRNSDDDLFFGKKIIITKSKATSMRAVDKVVEFWDEIGCQVQFLTAKKHDQIYALISHFPQLISFITKDVRAKTDLEILVKHLRLENSNNKIWRDIFCQNLANIDHYLKFYLQNHISIIEKLQKKEYKEVILFLDSVNKLVSKLGLTPKRFPAHNQDLILERIIVTSCFVALPDISDFKNYGGSGFKDFVIILSYLKDFLHDQKLAIEMLAQSQKFLLNRLINIESKIKNYDK